jgi:hypothetical protein
MRSVSLPCPMGVDFGLDNREIFRPGNGSPQRARRSAGPSSSYNLPLRIEGRRPQHRCSSASEGPAPDKLYEPPSDGGGEPRVRTT